MICNVNNKVVGLIVRSGVWQIELDDGTVHMQWREPGVNLASVQSQMRQAMPTAQEETRISLNEAVLMAELALLHLRHR